MKTKLTKKSSHLQEKLDAVVKEILGCAADKVAMVILFGSYAKGTWVSDRYVEDGILYSYESDLDILIVTTKGKYAGNQGIKIQDNVKKRLKRKFLDIRPPITFILEPITYLNAELEKKRYFFTDIVNEGVMLYDSGEFTLAKPRELKWEEVRQIAIDDYEQWFYKGSEFLAGSNFYAFDRNNLSAATFILHQATECLYNTILLVFSGYKPKLHDIEKLGSLASNYSDELLKIFPRDTEEQDKCFELLKLAYIEARYNKHYKITQEQLRYLMTRVEKLKIVTETICTARIGSV